MKKTNSRGKKILQVFLFSLIIIIIIINIAFFSIYFSAKLDKTAIYAKRSNVSLFDRNCEPLSNTAVSRYVSYDEISPNIVNAFVALEDKRYFTHSGIDYYRTVGAMVNNLKAGYFKEGGSTITQQLAKNTQLSNEKTIKRKIKEFKLARDIERNFSKEEIVEMYLNYIYFGNGIYGIDSASKYYFHKPTSELLPYEGAILAGLVKNPTKYSTDDALINQRKDLVLKLMYNQKFITEKVYEEQTKIKYRLETVVLQDYATPYVNNVISEAARLLNISEKDVLVGNYKIFTFYDAKKQKAIYKAFESKEYETLTKGKSTADYMSMIADNVNGGINAYYSNFNLSQYKFSRQPGSTIKPILVYAPSLESGMVTPYTPYLDVQQNYDGYTPSNYAGKYLGWTDITTALMTSSNVISVDLLNKLGIEYAKTCARECGIRFDIRDNSLSLALGGMTYGVSFSELSSAFMTLANGGEYNTNAFIDKIYDKDGRIIYQKSDYKRRVFSKETAYLTTKMLESTAKSGTAKKLSDISDIASKTGTVSWGDGDYNRDAWNVSYSANNTVCTWYGALKTGDNNLITSTGGGMPTLLSKYIWQNANLKREPFVVPQGIINVDIDSYGAQIDHKIYLAGALTLPEYRRTVQMDKYHLPTEFYSYGEFSSQEIDVQLDGNNANINFICDNCFNYKILRTNLFTNEQKQITDIRRFLNIASCKDSGLTDNTAYSYELQIFSSDDVLLFTSDKKVIFT